MPQARKPTLSGDNSMSASYETQPAAKPPNTWPQTAQLILLAFHDDNHIAQLAGQELLARLDMPAIPLVHDDGRRKVIRRKAT
jgi:hypothetical protein